MILSDAKRRRTLTDCYAEFGISSKGRNIRSWWSDDAPNGLVVVTLWTDLFSDIDATTAKYSCFGRGDLPKWRDRWQNRRGVEHLKSVGIENEFQSIIQRSTNPTTVPRQTLDRFIGPRMRLTALNELTGEFSAEEVGED